MKEKINLENELFMEGLELMAQQRDRILIWEQAFHSYLNMNRIEYEDLEQLSSLQDYHINLMSNAYAYANRKLEEYIERERNEVYRKAIP